MLFGLGRVRAVASYVTLAVVVNLVISVALAPRLGISGVIIGTFVGFGLATPLYIVLVLRELSTRFRDFFGRLSSHHPVGIVFAGCWPR